MPVNWKDPSAFTRLLAAMVAAQDMKVGMLVALPYHIKVLSLSAMIYHPLFAHLGFGHASLHIHTLYSLLSCSSPNIYKNNLDTHFTARL